MKTAIKPDSGNLAFEHAITRWDEALPLGNGFCGALIWGPSDGLRFSLDRGDLWDATPCSATADPGYNYPNMVKLAKEGKEEEIRRIFDAPYNHPTPSKLPAGKLIFNFGSDLPQHLQLDIETAQAHVQLGETTLDAFVHAEKKMGLIQISCPAGGFGFTVENPEYGLYTGKEKEVLCNSVATADLKLLKYPPVKKGDGWFVQKISGGVEYGVFTAQKKTENKTLLAWCVASSADGEHWKEEAEKMLAEALSGGYEKELEAHSSWWKEYWAQSRIEIPCEECNHNWYLTQYLLASCSRKGCYPMPLQGVWTADDGKLPPWKGDYHHDLNTELSYTSYLKAGHFAEGECFLDYLWKMRGFGAEFAKKFYHAAGSCLPGTMTQNGDSLGGWGMYSLSPSNQLWLCQSFERHWRFTGDDKFLKEKAYPYLQDSAAFILSLLEVKDGRYYLPVSSSPEIHDDTIASFLTPNSNYDLSLMRWLFTALAAMSKELNDGKEAKWKAHLAKLPELAVSETGILMLSPDELLQESHRHFSHAMAIYPLRLLPYEGKNKAVIDATVKQLEELGTDYWVGYSFGWLANMYAVQHQGEKAAASLHDFWNGFCSPNGFHLNGDYKNLGLSTFHYRPFTLEANFFAADALQEMLLFTQWNRVELFPAIPRQWAEKKVAFADLRGEKGLRVSAVLQNGRLTELTLKTGCAQKLKIKDSWQLKALLQAASAGFDEEDGWLTLNLEQNREYSF